VNRAALFGAYEAIIAHKAVDSAVDSDVSVLAFPSGAGGRLVVSPTGSLDRDYDDCRRFFDAAEKGVERAIKAGAKSPILFVHTSAVAAARFPHATDAAVLGAHTAMCVRFRASVLFDVSMIDLSE
jgi:leucyl aminopeptidase